MICQLELAQTSGVRWLRTLIEGILVLVLILVLRGDVKGAAALLDIFLIWKIDLGL